jgi:hypothetical protein
MKGNLSRIGKHLQPRQIMNKGGSIDLFDINRGNLDPSYSHSFSMAGVNAGNLSEYFEPIRGVVKTNNQTTDQTGPYDTQDIYFSLPSTGTDSNGDPEYKYKVYLRHKYTIDGTSTSFYMDDQAVGLVQIFDMDGNITDYKEPYFAAHKWQTTTYPPQSGTKTPAQASVLSYTSTIVNSGSSTGYDRWNVSTSTTSSYTGVAGGVSQRYYGTNSENALPLGKDTVESTVASYMLYSEASGASGEHNDAVYARTNDVLTFPERGYIRVAYFISTRSGVNSNGLDPDDSLFVGVYPS